MASSTIDPALGEPTQDRSFLSRMRAPLLLAAPVVLIVGGLVAWLHGGRFEETDDAYVQAQLVSVSPSVSGHVVAMYVHDNQMVRAGDVLFRIDPDRFSTALHSAEAHLADATTAIAARQADYAAALAKAQASEAQLDYAVREAARQKDLLAQGISSQDQFDQAALAVRTAQTALAGARQQADSIKAALSGKVDAPAGDQPAVRAAAAALDSARLDMGYTLVRAAQDGMVTKVSGLNVGDYVSAGKPVFTLVPHHMWIEANFKEGQLRYMRVGQPAEVQIDAYADHKLRARVASFSPGTGNAFALLPAENATGNWVKVVQRLPVELELVDLPADLPPLHAGLSVTATVDTGHVRRLADGLHGHD
jgi:membrane fusion protein, multidrug efflux system